MSLKSRLRVAISLLMAAVVVALSLLYAGSFLTTEFTSTRSAALSLAGQVQSSVVAFLGQAQGGGSTTDEIKKDLTSQLQRSPGMQRMLQRALENWSMVAEIYITTDRGEVVLSTMPSNAGSQARPIPSVDIWQKQSPFVSASDLLMARENAEASKAVTLVGEDKTFLVTHVVVSTPVLRDTLRTPLLRLAGLFLISLIVALILAILLPGLTLNPLEQLSERIDRMATGTLSESQPLTRPRRAKEVDDVYSKLDLLGEQFRGARENVADMRTHVERLLEHLEQAVLLVDPTGRLIMAGPNAGRLLNVDPKSLIGKLLPDIAPPGSPLWQALESVIQTDESTSYDAIVVEGLGESRTLALTSEPISRGPGGRSMGRMILLRNADTRGALEAELGLADRLQAISRLTRGVAHEIKNPLNAIRLHLEILRNRLEEPGPEVDVISREISRLDRVVKTFLDFNRPVEPQLRKLDLNEIVEELVRLVGPQTKERKVELRLELGQAPMIQGDPDLLKQAVLNVIMNAMEAMPNGGVLTVLTRRVNDHCELAVSDTGAGIPLAVRDRVFSLYFSTKKEGSGIGLALAYRFVQLCDGKLDFVTEIDKGTTFRFSFPEAAFPSRATLATRSLGA